MQPEWLEYAEREYGYGRVSVKGRHMTFEYVHSETGRVADSVELKIGRSALKRCNGLTEKSMGDASSQYIIPISKSPADGESVQPGTKMLFGQVEHTATLSRSANPARSDLGSDEKASGVLLS